MKKMKKKRIKTRKRKDLRMKSPRRAWDLHPPRSFQNKRD